MTELTLEQKWAAMRKTALSDHDPFCNYGATNGREMCTCQVLVDIMEYVDEPTTDEARALAAGDANRAGTRSEQRARRLAERRTGASPKPRRT